MSHFEEARETQPGTLRDDGTNLPIHKSPIWQARAISIGPSASVRGARSVDASARQINSVYCFRQALRQAGGPAGPLISSRSLSSFHRPSTLRRLLLPSSLRDFDPVDSLGGGGGAPGGGSGCISGCRGVTRGRGGLRGRASLGTGCSFNLLSRNFMAAS